jgi:CubicO group peptidase (beta-lactamase class C family)
VHGLRTAVAALAAVLVLLSQGASAQSLTVALFERYLEPLRRQAGIPGLSAAIVQGRRIVWERGFGMADVERSIPPDADTPYAVGTLTQIFGAVVVLQQVERGYYTTSDPIWRWTTVVPSRQATIGQVLSHTSTGSFLYDASRFAALTPVVEYYAQRPFPRVVADEILERLAMFDSVPVTQLPPAAPERAMFEDRVRVRYDAVLQRLAVPYRVDVRLRPTRSELPAGGTNAATGLVSTVRDLAKFDAALDSAPLLLASHPLGNGWFVQSYNNHRVVWQFGILHGAYSALVVKVPRRDLTLILLANSDGLAATFNLERGDVTASPFARVFLRAFVG